MCIHHFGDISVTKVTEQHGPGFAPDLLYPDWDPAVLEQHRALMIPDCFDESQQRFIASIHTWVVKTRHHTILIDSCAGNHKHRPDLARFHQLDLPFMERLAEAGVTPESVDYVMCTHLHADHCGWNTRLVDGRWVPTFPNARYIFSKAEYDYWESRVGEEGFNANVFEDSVLPVVASRQADMIDGAGTIGDDLIIHSTPGHSVGHIAIELINSAGTGIFSGDIMHQPLQVVRPDWNSRFCENPELAKASRRWVLEHAAEQNSTVFTAHFSNSSAGRVSRRGDRFEWRFI
ncbi:MBL fold metallo-hydrolase [Collimonas sp.]|jgi:glyoxylase-like metal-dependent hydrolase (beta-lactamase superfamily II)|uniref:MBL fold metallo-hydrolase n=1 Tax=Collimonas sp. TaxID=1963772 RepID=UPI002BC634EA|nr:MBL fold metallo-hydrolase [Collimonas sp.]HWX02266.1 MBL fold metallo-hydrolase [Collimonas sp.]